MTADGGPVDVLRYETDDGPVYRSVEAGRGEAVVDAHQRELRKRRLSQHLVAGVLALAIAGYGMFTESLLLGALGAAAVIVATIVGRTGEDEMVPQLVEQNIYPHDAEREYDIENE
ncbi:hypothetical protein [Halosimplex sp. J119]